MKYWIVICTWALIYFLLSHMTYAAPPLPSINNTKVVTIPAIKSDDGGYWEAELQCDNKIQNCIVVYAKEICQPGITRFSPSFCWEIGR